MILLSDIDENPQARATGRDFRVSTTELVTASATETLLRSPLSSLARFRELSIAESKDKSSPKMTSEEFQKSEFFRPGLSFPNGVGQRVAKITAERKDAENLRNFTIRTGSSQLSAFGQVGVFGTNLMAAMLDPLNIASAFVPIVGQARFASMVSKVGFTGARAGKGAVEGLVGAALVEPIVLLAANQEQADYDSMDSLLNVAFGTVFGAGLHVAAGKVGDIIRGHPPELREVAVRTAVSQVLDGRKVDIEPLTKVSDEVNTDPNTGLEVPSRSLDPLKDVMESEGTRPTNENVISKLDEVVNRREPIEGDKAIIDEISANPELQKLADILKKPDIERTAEELAFLKSFADKRESVVIDTTAETLRLKEIDAEIKKAKNKRPRTDEKKAAKKKAIETLQEEKQRLEIQKNEKESLGQQKTEQKKSTFSEEELRTDVENTFKPEADSTYNKSDVDLIDEVITESKRSDLKQELADSEKQIETLKEQGLLKDEDLVEYNEANKIIADVDKMESVIDAIAVCAARG